MSESDKMGLFGSKDENNDKTTEENDNFGKAKETQSENFAPYNIDSDSETYDTEALSMMDINDIIGVQGDAPGESTLESEFAALSEIITDSKDDFALQDDKPADIKASTEEKDCDKEGTSESDACDAKKSKKLAGTGSINKSLQLIGEAYISEDSQGTDSEDTQDRAVEISADTNAAGEDLKNSDNKVSAASSRKNEEAESSTLEEEIAETIVGENDNSCNIEAENSESAKEPSKGTTIVESADSTDSIDVEAKENPKEDDVESMIVDLVEADDISEKLPRESHLATDKSKDAEIAETAEIKDRVEEMSEVERKVESTESEEPMEVEQAEETLVATEKASKSESRTEVNTAGEKSNLSEDATVPVESVEDESELERLKNSIIEKPESERAVEESMVEENQTEKPDSPIEKSKIEKNQIEGTEETGKNDTTDEASTKREFEIEKNSDSPVKGENTSRVDDGAEPMEIDGGDEENAEIVPKIAENSPRNDEKASDRVTKDLINADNAEKTSDVATKSPENSDDFEKDSLPDLPSKESSEDTTILAKSESREKTINVEDAMPVASSADVTSTGTSARDTEDDKMEVDGVPKDKMVEKIEQVLASPKKLTESTTEIEKNEDILEKQCSIDTVDEAAKTPPEHEKIEAILEESIKNPNGTSSTDKTEIRETEITEPESDEVEKQSEKTRVTEEKMRETEENSEAAVNEESEQNDEEASIFVEKLESSEETTENEDTDSMNVTVDKSAENEKRENEAILTTERKETLVEKPECLEKKSQDVEKKLIADVPEMEKTRAIPNGEEKNDEICSEFIESPNKKDEEIVEISLPSVETEFSTEEENLIPSDKIEPSRGSADEVSNTYREIESSSLQENANLTEEKSTSEEKNVIRPENVESSPNEETSTSLSSLNVKKQTDAASERTESPKSKESETYDANFSENLESSTDLTDKIEEEKSASVELPAEIPETEKDARSAESEENISVSMPEEIDNVEITRKPEEEISSKADGPSDESIPSSVDTTPNLVVEQDQVGEKISVKTVSEIFEAPENPIEEDSATAASPNRMFEKQKDENEINTEMDVPMATEEKEDERNDVQLDDCPANSSTYKSEENEEETREKEVEDTGDNYVSVTEMFRDDEQSQSTQEMMVSILETDKGNINKILDDQEADDLETSAMNDMAKLPNESEDMLNKALEDDPMTTQNIDSLEGLLDLDLMPDNDESNLKSVEPIVPDDMETIGKNVDVSLLLEENDAIGNSDRSDNYNPEIVTKIMNNDREECLESSVDNLMNKSTIEVNREIEGSTELTEKDLEAFDLASVVANPLEEVDPTGETKIDLAEDLLREIAVDEERKIVLTEKLLLEDNIQEQDLLLSTAIQQPRKIDLPDEVFLPVESEREIELAEDISLDSAVREQVLNDVAAEMDNLPPNSEISELESAVKFLQESEEQDMDLPLVLSPKMVEDVVNDIAENSNVGIFTTDAEICEDPSALAAELESIIPDPIAISEAEIINEAAKLEIERRTKLTQETKVNKKATRESEFADEFNEAASSPGDSPKSSSVSGESERRDDTEKHEEIVSPKPEVDEVEREPLKKSAPIPKISILEERLKIPPKIEIPVGEVTRMCELPTTPKTSLLIQRDVRTISLTKQLESPKSMDGKSEMKIVDTPRKDSEKHDFENVGSPRIILKIAKSAIADCSEPRSPKSPKIRSATNSPNPEDSPGQKLGKIKLKLSKGGHPSIISNDNVDENCGQWHTEGSSSLSPLGMKIKFSKISENPSAQSADKHENDEGKEQTVKHKFEEARRTESPLGMKIKLSKTGEPSIVQQETKDAGTKHREKSDVQHDSPKRTESSIGMKIKLSKSGDASIIQPEKQEILDEYKEGIPRSKETSQQHGDRSDASRRTESPLGMKFKIFKTGDASIVQTEPRDDSQQEAKRTDSPVGKKMKLSRTRGGTPVSTSDHNEDARQLELGEETKRTDSPLGMKIKLTKRGDASIIHSEETREGSRQKGENAHETAQPIEGASHVAKTKVGKSSSSVQPEVPSDNETIAGTSKRADPTIGMKIKLSKSGDASIVHPEHLENPEETRKQSDNLEENIRRMDSPFGMTIKLSKSGDASIVQSQSSKKSEDQSSTLESRETESSRTNEGQTVAKAKIQKSTEATIVEAERKEKSARKKDAELPLEMKIKLSKTGHPTIVACENFNETQQRAKETMEIASPLGTSKQRSSSPKLSPKDNSGMKILKGMHGGGLHGGRSELTIEPVQLQPRRNETRDETAVSKRKDVTISPVELKKAKIETKLTHILPEVTIQPIIPRDQKQQIMFEAKAGSISRQQMNVISQEISITQVRSNKPMDLVMTDKLKTMLTKNPAAPGNDCEIIEHRPELIIVNENSNSSQDVMIIEEVPVLRVPEVKVPKKRGRPRRNPLPIILTKPTASSTTPGEPIIQRDPLALDDIAQLTSHMGPKVFPPIESEASGRPKRMCRNQKSYAPPRRGRRGRGGRGKRKMDMCMELEKRPRMEQDLDVIERSTTALISIHEPPGDPPRSTNEAQSSCNTSELYKALRQPTMDRKMPNAIARNEIEMAVNEARNNADLITKSQLESFMDARIMSHLDGVINKTSTSKASYDENRENDRKLLLVDISSPERRNTGSLLSADVQKSQLSTIDDKIIEKNVDETKDGKDTSSSGIDHENWLTPSSKKQCDVRNEGNISNVQVMDEETRMSAESGSRSQTPAKNMSAQASETIVNEESQGSVLSTATTESEKVKVKSRRMEINFDPDEGPFTVDKIAEYDWPQDPSKKNETFMIQEQISHYLGVKSFKRKYPDLKRRMVDMEERNYLRENGLVSEAMCDMGLTAVLSAEVLDIMCSDFPDQYEEYRKHMREKQMKEHFKKQKELTAAANAEKNRIDLAEMAVQSALSWNVGLNKARRESRKCSLDLQTFTIHVPKKQQKIEEESNSNHYPVALIPGQYTDYYREYTPAELRYYPLNTVLYGPMRPNERKFDSQSEGSQSDSDSDSSSDDSSSSSSEGTQDTEASQSTMDDVDAELSRQKEDIKSIKCKMCLKHLNKFSRTEVLIQCGTCNGYVHPSCIDLTLDMVPHIQAYAWQCTDCKTCAQCHDPADEDKMLFCDMCDRGYHIYCVGLRRVPQGRWHCQECAVCASCGSREAGGTNSDRNSVAQWQHEYKKGDKNTRVYVSTLCVPCSKLWRKGRYCPHCSRCHTVQRLDLEVNLVHCSACDKYLHLGCVESKDLTIDRKNYRCDFCQSLRHHVVKPLVSKVFGT